jgi:hypothetical protein
MTAPPRLPGDLKSSGRALWRKLTAAYVLDECETEVLARCARLADLEHALLEGLKTSGVVTTEGTPPAVGRLLATQNPVVQAAREPRSSGWGWCEDADEHSRGEPGGGALAPPQRDRG